MKARLATAAFFVVIGILLPVVAVAKRGPPWGFRGHDAVLLEATGDVEIMASEQRRQREKREDAALEPKAGLFLDAGDEVRVSRYGQARLRTPTADLVVGDAADVVLGDKDVTITRGIVDVRLPGGTTPFEVKAAGVAGKLTLRPGGGEGGAVRVLVDGSGALRALVQSGSCEGTAPGGDEIAESGRVVVVGPDKKPRVEAKPTALALTPRCDGKKLTVDVPAGAQVFVGAKVRYPKDGQVVVDVAGGKVPVFARDLAGDTARVEADCTHATKTK